MLPFGFGEGHNLEAFKQGVQKNVWNKELCRKMGAFYEITY
jgi:hypothetical protein